jgi:hypothetical protein
MLDNKSEKEIKEMSVSLKQKLKFYASSGQTKEETRSLTSVKYPQKISKRSLENWNNIALQVPVTVSTSNGFCRIIEVSYKVVLNFDASGVAISKF